MCLSLLHYELNDAICRRVRLAIQVASAKAKATKAGHTAESLRKERNSFMTKVSRTPLAIVSNYYRLLVANVSGICSRRTT